MKRFNVPLYNALIEYSNTNPVSFHMPGHKMGKGLPEDFIKNLSRIDLTEIQGTDNLHYPEGIILKAQEHTAEVFGADTTFFLVNGSTCGIHAMVMSVCKPGERLIIGRDCHKSVISAMILAGVEPIYIKPEFNRKFGIPGTIDVQLVKSALANNPDVKGVLITRPNYYGVCSNIESIARVVHSYGKILLVDEAHGAHLSFCHRLPESALESGADICVQSAHKTLPAFTQGAYLHVKSNKVDIERLKFILSMLQTSSPSYIIMASLDVACGIMEECGEQYLDRLINGIQWFKNRIDSHATLRMLGVEDINNGELDQTRIVINVGSTGMTGFNMEKVLRKDFNIQVEMSDYRNIVCITSISDSMQDFGKLHEALLRISHMSNNKVSNDDIYVRGVSVPRLAIKLSEIAKRESSHIKLDSAVGRISRNIITPYPPGIPLICPGESITQDSVDYIKKLLNCGCKVNGVSSDFEVNVIR